MGRGGLRLFLAGGAVAAAAGGDSPIGRGLARSALLDNRDLRPTLRFTAAFFKAVLDEHLPRRRKDSRHPKFFPDSSGGAAPLPKGLIAPA